MGLRLSPHKHHPQSALLAGALSLAVGVGCASLPASYPPASPASTEASEAPSAVVTRALEADPPLPGAEDEHTWLGFQPAPAASSAGGPAAGASHSHHEAGAHPASHPHGGSHDR